MGNAATVRKRLTPEEYLAQELASPTRAEYVDGLVFAMSGASDRHGLIASGLFTRLFDHVPPPCQAFMTDMRLRIRDGDTTTFYYPDIIVSCAEDDRERYFREKPVLLVEIISPSTERVDRTEKVAAYRRIPTLLEFVIGEQDELKVDVFRRRTGWQTETFLAGEAFTLESVGLELAVDDIYRRTVWP